MINKTINGYTIKRVLGEGGMAEVWYAETSIGKPAAIKFLKERFCKDENVTARFENEARVMVKLDHPNIRQVYDYTQEDGRPCIIMEYLDGVDLKATTRTRGRMDAATAARYWDAIVSALNYTHKQGVVHRDIKPSNIFITSKGQVKLLDFGIAKVRDAVTGTQTGQKLGTLVYMSPEQITDSKHVDFRTDIYSLAVTFVHLLSGRIPYNSDSSSDFEIMKQIVERPLDMIDVPTEWQAFLQPYLAKNPAERPELIPFSSRTTADTGAGADDMTLVENATSRETPKHKPETSGMASPRNPRKAGPQTPAKNARKRLLWIIGGAVAAVLLAVLLIALLSNRDSSKENPDPESVVTDTIAVSPVEAPSSVNTETSKGKTENEAQVKADKQQQTNVNDLSDLDMLDDKGLLALYEEEESTVKMPAKMPEFPGGMEALRDFLRREVKYPEVAKNNGITGTVLVEFAVEKDGRVTNAWVKVPLFPDCDKEAVRAVKAMPKWKPGKDENGNPVRCNYQVPVTFSM